jgi:hypothetical protein
MNIVVGKFGRSIMFDSSKWAAIGGDNEPSAMFAALARLNPDKTFYMIGKSDWDNSPELPNLINVWKWYREGVDDYTYFPLNFLKDVRIDAGIIMSGPVSQVNIPGEIIKTSGEGIAKSLIMFEKYVGPVLKLLNERMTPYVVLSPDPRYIKPGRDFINPPRLSISQYNTTVKYSRIKSMTEQLVRVPVKVPVKYSGLETMFLLGKDRPAVPDHKGTKMMIVLNEGGNGSLMRGPMLKEYVLDNFEDVEVYGKWSEEWYSDKRFRGPVKFNVLQEKLVDVKYTFIIPIQKGWVTAKIWEMMYYGIVPFMHPYYDSQRHLPVPDFLRVKSPREFLAKIDVLERYPEKYRALVDTCVSLIRDEHRDGTFLNRVIFDEIAALGIAPQEATGVEALPPLPEPPAKKEAKKAAPKKEAPKKSPPPPRRVGDEDGVDLFF